MQNLKFILFLLLFAVGAFLVFGGYEDRNGVALLIGYGLALFCLRGAHRVARRVAAYEASAAEAGYPRGNGDAARNVLLFFASLGGVFGGGWLTWGGLPDRHTVLLTVLGLVAAIYCLKLAFSLSEQSQADWRLRRTYEEAGMSVPERGEARPRRPVRPAAPGGVFGEEDAAAIGQLLAGVDRMEQRVGNLETILLDHRRATRREGAQKS